jgi:hypothetical protein
VKKQLSASILENKAVNAKLVLREAAASKDESLIMSLSSEVDSLKIQLSTLSRSHAFLQTQVAAFKSSSSNSDLQA